MSYDIRVWGRQAANLAECLLPSQGWTERDRGWALEKRSWQIVVSEPQYVEPEDVPADAADALPGVTVLVEMSLEPGAAPKAAHSTLLSSARAVDRLLPEGVAVPTILTDGPYREFDALFHWED